MNRDFDPKMGSSVPGSDGATEAGDFPGAKKKSSGFGDTKKVVILLSLMAVAGAVVAYQYLGSSGPKGAEAAVTSGPSEPATAAAKPASATEAAPAATGQVGDVGTAELLSVAGVEDLSRRLDTYVQERQIPMLLVNPFEVAQPKQAPAATLALTELAATVEAAAQDTPKAPRVSSITGRFTLGSVMIVGSKRLAIINGTLCHVGDTIEGCLVESILPAEVLLTRDGDSLQLTLKRSTAASKGK
jgi:hypothetical protein